MRSGVQRSGSGLQPGAYAALYDLALTPWWGAPTAAIGGKQPVVTGRFRAIAAAGKWQQLFEGVTQSAYKLEAPYQEMANGSALASVSETGYNASVDQTSGVKCRKPHSYRSF